jgi:uncharacterized protein YciI
VALTVFHVAVTTCEDYLERRRPGRDAHHAQLLAWRAAGTLIAAGPAPDGKLVDLFWRAEDEDAVAQLMQADRFVIEGLWAMYVGRPFTEFIEPLTLPRLDSDRLGVIVEGRTADGARAAEALRALRADGRVAFGGFFAEGDGLALTFAPEPHEALRWLASADGWVADGLKARPFHYVL